MRQSIIGHSTKGDGKAPIFISQPDRSGHLLIVGATGTGKSTLTKNLVKQDIANGFGCTFIDPHGMDAEDILNHIPGHRVKDVLYFNPQDLERPCGFNMLQYVDLDDQYVIAGRLLSAFKHFWHDTHANRLENINRFLSLTLLKEHGNTVLHFERILSDEEYRGQVLRRLTDPALRSFWINQLSTWGKEFRSQSLSPVYNRVGVFTANPMLRNILGHAKSSFDIEHILDAGKIVIVNLAGIDDKSRDFLAAMLFEMYVFWAMRRQKRSGDHWPWHNLYLAEAASFSSSAYALLPEVRKFKLTLSMEIHYLDQFENQRVGDAIVNNCRSIVSFGVGPNDAERLVNRYASDLKVSDFTDLATGEAQALILQDGAQLPVPIRTHRPIMDSYAGKKKEVINQSRSRYGRPREKIEKRVARILAPIEPVGKRRVV